jgi:hypothetical protein
MITGAPGKALRVNMAANAFVGCSSEMSVRVMFAGFGASSGMNSNRVQPTRNPAGNAAWVASHARWASRLAKLRFVLGTRRRCVAARRSEEEFWRSSPGERRSRSWGQLPHGVLSEQPIGQIERRVENFYGNARGVCLIASHRHQPVSALSRSNHLHAATWLHALPADERH